MIQKIITEPNPLLHQTSKEVSFPVSKEVKQIASDLMEMVQSDKGAAGLSATQIGKLYSVVVVTDLKRNPKLLINPKVTMQVGEKIRFPEGCLSLPNKLYLVSRNDIIKYSYCDLKGKIYQGKAKGWEARVILHEIDHMKGILVSDIGTPITDKAAQSYYEDPTDSESL